ncbi:MAG: hypothetical protein FK730_02315 [Asgard group archaeon]|nr:hypothetical protein [Asgard group archaeon]
MNNDKPKNKEKFKTLKSIVIVIVIGVIQGGICGIIGLLLSMINDYAIFSIVILWLIFGWFTTYIIKIQTLEILTVIVSGNITSFLVLYFSGIRIWVILIIIGVSMLFWGISFVTKLMLFPRITTNEALKDDFDEK